MNIDRSASLSASFWVMIILRTSTSMDMPGKGPRKMPSPSTYVSIFLVWTVLQIVYDIGFKRISLFGWLIVLSYLVLGPGGKLVEDLIAKIASIYGGTSPAIVGAPATTSNTSQPSTVNV